MGRSFADGLMRLASAAYHAGAARPSMGTPRCRSSVMRLPLSRRCGGLRPIQSFHAVSSSADVGVGSSAPGPAWPGRFF